MKKLMIVALVAAFPVSQAFAAPVGLATACDPALSQAAQAPVLGVSTNFIVSSFKPQCSKNVNVRYNQGQVAVAVGSNSLKGKNSFVGSSLGGQVNVQTGCAAACTQAEADAAANTINSSSL